MPSEKSNQAESPNSRPIVQSAINEAKEFPLWKRLAGVIVLPMMLLGIIALINAIPKTIQRLSLSVDHFGAGIGSTIGEYVVYLLFIWPGISWIRAFWNRKK